MSSKSALILLAVLIGVLAGCGSAEKQDDGVLSDRRFEYKKSRNLERNLEIPPDLTRSSVGDGSAIPDASGSVSATYSEVMGGRANRTTAGTDKRAILPQVENVQMQRDGDQRWLLIEAPAEAVWPQVAAFWQENGILLVEQDPVVGIMVTDWIENRADIKSDFLTDTIRSVFDGLYSSATRDQFRVRLERGPMSGATELYLTQRGMQEDVGRGVSGESEQMVWIPREHDPELEAEMLRRLMVYLGVSEERAKRGLAQQDEARQRAQMHKAGGEIYITVFENLERTWRLTGVALDRVGFAVEDRDRVERIYDVRYDDPMKDDDEGFLASLAFWRDDADIDKEGRYQVKLSDQGGSTRIQVRGQDGQPRSGDTAERILNLIHEQLR